MPRYKRNSVYNAARKRRRIAKYGKYARPAGAMVRYGYGKGRGTKKILVPKFLNPFKRDSEFVQLKYRENITLNPTADTISAAGSGAGAYVFSFNSIYDPNFTGTGNQPMYRDNYAGLYGKYKVSFAKIKVTVVNHTVNTAVWNGSIVAAQPNYSYKLAILRDATDNEAYNTSMDALLMQNATNVKWRYVAPQLNGKLPSLSMKCAPHKTAGVAYDDDTLQSNMLAEPSRNIKGTIMITSADGITDPPNVNLTVEITYYVKFFDRNTAQPTN